ncbi:ATP-binding protein [Aureivirga marina]|uniref:ATP-binding protein n=1 Tax=Aureivirga marina TaxID=1182451 RepID=UPI001E5D3D64|nr:ATP-binding protein [Aureivirga marina]
MDGKSFDSEMDLMIRNNHVNTNTILEEILWFEKILEVRFNLYFNNETAFSSINEILAPNLSENTSFYASFVKSLNLNFHERLVFILALIPHIKPAVLDILFTKNERFDKAFTEFGGANSDSHKGFIPTIETALFLLAGNNLGKRIEFLSYFETNHIFSERKIFENFEENTQFFKANNPLKLTLETLKFIFSGEKLTLTYSANFPAKRITTKLKWEDLVLQDFVYDELDDIVTWVNYSQEILMDWDLHKKVKNGFRALFYGPPGTGKTLTATLIGKLTDLDVYRIDLSMLVSKYIGETEKNLAKVFDVAEHKNWILFFDEADALFGKRTMTSSSNDRHANQEIAYLLQRIEDYNGIIILASNLKGNLDEAFSRRFQSMIYFPIPEADERYLLWKKAFGDKLALDKDVDLFEISKKYEIAGGAISNILRYCAIKAKQRNTNIVLLSDIEKGIRKELKKVGKE